MSRRDDVYNPPLQPEPTPHSYCSKCRQPLEVVMGNAAPHDCPAKKKPHYIPPQFERGGRDWMA